MSRCLLIALLTLGLAQVGMASSEEDIFNVDVSFGWDHYYRPMEWTPVVIGIDSTLTEPFDGSVVISAQQDDLNTMNIAHDFVLTPNMRQNLPLVTKFAYAATECDVRILEKNRGRPVWRHEFNMWDYTPAGRTLTAVEETELLVGLIGRRTFSIQRLPKQSVCLAHQTANQSFTGKVYIAQKSINTAPWDWTGFASLDLLVLYDPDWNSFRRPQLTAIRQWVSNGGKLLLVLGTHPVTADNPLADILPADIGQARQITIAPSTLEGWGLSNEQPETVNYWPLRPKSDVHLYRMESADVNECIFAAAYSDFGRVGLLAFDPSGLSGSQQDKASLFWIGRFAAVLEDIELKTVRAVELDVDSDKRSRTNRGREITNSLPVKRTIRYTQDSEKLLEKRNMNSYRLGGAYYASNAVMNYLYKGIRPLSIWWVILLLTALAVLLGPVDYIVLKRKDRLPLTWLTCTFWIVTFTIGAYYGVQALRAGDMELRVVSVQDAIEDSNSIWSTDYCGLFAPRSAEYRFKDLDENQWWSGIAPMQQNLWYRRQTGSNRIYCRQRDGFNLPYSLPVNIWTIQCLMKESPGQKQLFEARVSRQGDEVSLDITNLSDAPISGGYVLFDENRGRDFGEVPAKGSRQFTGPIRSLREWADENVKQYNSTSANATFDHESAFFAQSSLQRTEAMKRYLANGAAVVCARFSDAPLSYGIDSRLCGYDHIQLARLVVFPKQSNKEMRND